LFHKIHPFRHQIGSNQRIHQSYPNDCNYRIYWSINTRSVIIESEWRLISSGSKGNINDRSSLTMIDRAKNNNVELIQSGSDRM
ncbi:hypothetical protein ACT691_20805, partial [Vibrio metschnikovii]